MKRLLTLFLLLIPVEAWAASSRVWIAEFSAYRVEAPAPFAPLPAMIKQPTIDISSGTAKSSAAFNTQTRYIRIVCEVQCAITATGTATVSDILLPALRPEYFGVQAGRTLSIIAAP